MYYIHLLYVLCIFESLCLIVLTSNNKQTPKRKTLKIKFVVFDYFDHKSRNVEISGSKDVLIGRAKKKERKMY